MESFYNSADDAPEIVNVILNYKTSRCQCPSDQPHDSSACFYSHTPKEERRTPVDPTTGQITYKHKLCKELECTNSLRCVYAHNNYEMKFHPSYYKTHPCKNFKNCTKQNLLLCPEYHENEQPRKSQMSHPHSDKGSDESRVSQANTLPFSQAQSQFTDENSQNADEIFMFNPRGPHPAELDSSSKQPCSKHQYTKTKSNSFEQDQRSKRVNSVKAGQRSSHSFDAGLFDPATFKTQMCKITTKHNLKHCIYYHNDNDRRRSQAIYKYSFDECQNIKNLKSCIKGDKCEMSHNKVELLYHKDRYKSKFCQQYPHKIAQCDYGDYCSFAHADSEISIQLIHKKPRDAIFYVWYYKTVWCPYTYNHDRGICPYAHNVQDFRRNPVLYDIDPEECKDWKKSDNITRYDQGGCPRNMQCTKCHGWKEYEYHPKVYKTVSCKNGINCQKKECTNFHSEQDRNKFKDGYLMELQEQNWEVYQEISEQLSKPKNKLAGMPINVFYQIPQLQQQLQNKFQQSEPFGQHSNHGNSYFASPIILKPSGLNNFNQKYIPNQLPDKIINNKVIFSSDIQISQPNLPQGSFRPTQQISRQVSETVEQKYIEDSRAKQLEMMEQQRCLSQGTYSRDTSQDSINAGYFDQLPPNDGNIFLAKKKKKKQKLNLKADTFYPTQSNVDSSKDLSQNAESNHKKNKTAPATPDVHKTQLKIDLAQKKEYIISQLTKPDFQKLSQKPFYKYPEEEPVQYDQDLVELFAKFQLENELNLLQQEKYTQTMITALSEEDIRSLDFISLAVKPKLYQAIQKFTQESEEMKLIKEPFNEQAMQDKEPKSSNESNYMQRQLTEKQIQIVRFPAPGELESEEQAAGENEIYPQIQSPNLQQPFQ